MHCQLDIPSQQTDSESSAPSVHTIIKPAEKNREHMTKSLLPKTKERSPQRGFTTRSF